MSKRLTLETVSKELFEIFESEIEFQSDRPSKSTLEERSQEYFKRISQESEISGQHINNSLMAEINSEVASEVLPAYLAYFDVKGKIQEKSDKRDYKKYVAGSIVVANILEFILTKGKSMRPGVFFPALGVEAAIGYGIYGLANMNDKRLLNRAKKQFFVSISNANKRLLSNQRHSDFQEIMDGDALESEAFNLLSTFENPEDFWREYRTIREINPTNTFQFEALNLPRFGSFLELHLKDRLAPEKREYRFNQLFLKAHEHFINKDSQNYVLGNLRGKNI